jgi:hypothetical protein
MTLPPSSRALRLALVLAAPLAVLLSTQRARAEPVAFTIMAGPTAYATSWRGDYGGGGTLRAGARFARVVGVEFQGWESYATVNHRVNTGLSLGLAGYVPLRSARPFARLFALHQHEESLVSVESAPAGVVLGVGPGIRHRAGGGLTLGLELPQRPLGRRVEPAFTVSANALWFPDALGPRWTFGLDLGVSLAVIPGGA